MRKVVYLLVIGFAVYFLYTKYTTPHDNLNPADTNGTATSTSPTVAPRVAPPQTGTSPGTATLPGSAYATVAEATQAALNRYPPLALAGSAFNKEYVSRYNRYKQEHPDYFNDTSWPVRLADEVAQVVPTQAIVRPATAPAFVTRHFATSLSAAKNAASIALQPGDAFSLAQIEEAKAKAQRERKPLGFIMCWGQFFGKKVNTRIDGSESAFIHFYQAFHNGVVLVFVRHETELQSVPEAVKKGFFGPDEGGFAPNMAVVDATASEFIVEIPMGGGGSDGKIRDGVFAAGAEKIDQWLATHPSAIGTAK